MSTETYTVVSTMKNEAPYILEWVAHYKTLGFDHILVCTNDCTDTTVEILRRLQEMGHVTQHDTVVRKAGIHRSALRQASRRYDIVLNAAWVFVCDVDEFLNIHLGDGSVRALVQGSGADADVISVPWRVFGPNGVVKSLYTNQHKFLRMGLHAPVSREEHIATVRRVLPGGLDYVVNGRRTDNPPLFTHAQVNHYALRSMDSFLVKRARGRANHSHHVLGKEYWDKFNLNDETDGSIARYSEQTSEWLERFKRDPQLADLHAKGVEWHRRKAASLRMDPDMDELVEAISADFG